MPLCARVRRMRSARLRSQQSWGGEGPRRNQSIRTTTGPIKNRLCRSRANRSPDGGGGVECSGSPRHSRAEDFINPAHHLLVEQANHFHGLEVLPELRHF